MKDFMLRIIQNDPEVPPGNLLDYLSVPYRIHHPYRGDSLPEIADSSALIVLGGAMGANDDARHSFLTPLKRFILEAIVSGIPYLGICLGGQLLAAAQRAEVHSKRWEEKGVLTVELTSEGRVDPLFNGVADEFTTFQWHHDSFDIPEGAILLASSAACPHQAFRVGTNAWGVQFHPEVTNSIIRDWCRWDDKDQKSINKLIEEFSRNNGVYKETSRQLVENFIRSYH